MIVSIVLRTVTPFASQRSEVMRSLHADIRFAQGDDLQRTEQAPGGIESGEDYPYPSSFFEAVELRAPVQKKLLHVA